MKCPHCPRVMETYACQLPSVATLTVLWTRSFDGNLSLDPYVLIISLLIKYYELYDELFCNTTCNRGHLNWLRLKYIWCLCYGTYVCYPLIYVHVGIRSRSSLLCMTLGSCFYAFHFALYIFCLDCFCWDKLKFQDHQIKKQKNYFRIENNNTIL
jgi:hypothetical protein